MGEAARKKRLGLSLGAGDYRKIPKTLCGAPLPHGRWCLKDPGHGDEHGELATAEQLQQGARYDLVRDADHPAFVLLSARMPYSGHPECHYQGAAARDRLLRFCGAFLDGSGMLSHAMARRIYDLANPEQLLPDRMASLLDLVAERSQEAGWGLDRLSEELEGRGVRLSRGAPDLSLTAGQMKLLSTSRGLAHDKIGPWRVVLLCDRNLDRHCFRLSALLESPTSSQQDWHNLGALVKSLGAPQQPVVPIEQLASDQAITWVWSVPVSEAQTPQVPKEGAS